MFINKLHLILIFLVYVSSCSLKSPINSCEKFKTGSFKLKSQYSGDFTLIDRNDSIQTEKSVNTGETLIAKIKWTSACEYELLYQTNNTGSSDSIYKLLQTQPLKVRIIQSGKDFYVFESKTDGVNLVYIDTMTVVGK